MAVGARPCPPESRPLHLLLLLSLTMAVGCCAGCKLDQCSRKYEEEISQQSLAKCDALSRYNACVQATGRSCRGDLKYHSIHSILGRQMSELGCLNTSPPPPPPPPAPSQVCTFKGRREFRHCGLFGDPHLKTFFREYQTCKVRGAWPLIDNPYLAVQVTNEPVMPPSQATATTKVTIVIRGKNSPCAQEKTYQATSDSPLPTTFIDGTQGSGVVDGSGGGGGGVILRAHDPQHVEIYVRYIETTLIVRQAGKYLAFSACMPDEVVRLAGEYLQLCIGGCPPAERLDLFVARGKKLSEDAALEHCRRSEAFNNLNLTDHYLDWCMFDVMTTGEDQAADFTAAAYHAQADVMRLDPESLKPSVQDATGSASYHITARTLEITTLILVLLQAWL